MLQLLHPSSSPALSMPSRKKIQPPPSFSFVTTRLEVEGVSWLKIHSGAARSHAAYWGGPEKIHHQGKKQIAGQQITTTSSLDTDRAANLRHGSKPSFDCFHAPTVLRRRSTKPKNVKTIVLPPQARSQSPPHLETDNMEHLPLIPSEIRATGSPSAAALSTFEFFGEGFVKQFVMFDHEDYSIMISGCRLLSYAHSMALTGQGTKTLLLQLKSQVIRRISAKMRSSEGLLSPQCLTAILALGAPIVCLVSQDLPKCLSISDYIQVSAQEDYLCCSASADTAQHALKERIIHRQAIRRLFFKSIASFRNADNLALLQYISNSINISMALEAAEYLHTPLNDVEDLFPSTHPCGSCSIPPQWRSPLTCQWLREASASHVEAQMLLLVGLMHRWLATFFDRDSCEVEPKHNAQEERAYLRESIEHFRPIAGKSNVEAEAMYESCRWASLTLLAVEKLSIPIHVAAKHVRIQPRLIRRLGITDLSNLWGIRKGLLFWVAAVCHFSTAGQCFPLLTTTLFARFAPQMAMLDCCSEIAIKPLRRLKLFESLCCREQLTR